MSSPAAVSDIYNSIHRLIRKLLQHHKLPIDTVTKQNRRIVSSLETVEHTARATCEADSLTADNEGAEEAEEAEEADALVPSHLESDISDAASTTSGWESFHGRATNNDDFTTALSTDSLVSSSPTSLSPFLEENDLQDSILGHNRGSSQCSIGSESNEQLEES